MIQKEKNKFNYLKKVRKLKVAKTKVTQSL